MKKMATDLAEKDSEIEILKGNQINLEKTLNESQINLIKRKLKLKMHKSMA